MADPNREIRGPSNQPLMLAMLEMLPMLLSGKLKTICGYMIIPERCMIGFAILPPLTRQIAQSNPKA